MLDYRGSINELLFYRSIRKNKTNISDVHRQQSTVLSNIVPGSRLETRVPVSSIVVNASYNSSTISDQLQMIYGWNFIVIRTMG